MVPSTRVQVLTENRVGLIINDPFRWLEDEQSDEVQAWMTAQDAFARAHLAMQPGRAMLLERYRALYYVDSLGVPVKRGGRYFYSRTHKTRRRQSSGPA